MQSSLLRDGIIYDDLSRLLRYKETVLVDQYIDVDNYSIYRANTLYSDFDYANGHGKTSEYTNYIVKPDLDVDPTATLEEANTLFLSHVGSNFAGFPSDDELDNYFYEKQNLATTYHKTGLVFRTATKFGTVNIWNEEEDTEFDLNIDPRPKTVGIRINRIEVNGELVTLEIIKSNIVYVNTYDAANPDNVDRAIDSFDLTFKVHHLDVIGDETGVVDDITDISNMHFGVDGEVVAYTDTFERNGITHIIARSEITYSGVEFSEYNAVINPPVGPSSYVHRSYVKDGDNVVVTDTYYQNGDKGVIGVYTSNIISVNIQTYNVSGELSSFSTYNGNIETRYQVANITNYFIIFNIFN